MRQHLCIGFGSMSIPMLNNVIITPIVNCIMCFRYYSTQFNSEADDGGFLEAKLKAAESTVAAIGRGQMGRKSFHYIRLKENHDLAAGGKPTANGHNHNDKDQLIRVHSLPASRIKKKSATLGGHAKKDAIAKTNGRIPVQGKALALVDSKIDKCNI